MSANRSVGRSTATHKNDRSAATPKSDRASLCSFTFADGRQCRTPRCSDRPHLCYFHARKEAQTLAAQEMGRDISAYLSGSYLSACDLSSALGRLFSAVAQGQVKPKTASTLAYLGQTILQSIHIAQDEYINAFGTNSWRAAVRSSFAPPETDPPPPAPQPKSQPDPPSDSRSNAGTSAP